MRIYYFENQIVLLDQPQQGYSEVKMTKTGIYYTFTGLTWPGFVMALHQFAFEKIFWNDYMRYFCTYLI